MLPLANDPACRPVRFELLADADPGLLPRILMFFARRDLMPDIMRARRSGETMQVELSVVAMPSAMVHLVEGNLRQVVGLRHLTVVLQRG